MRRLLAVLVFAVAAAAATAAGSGVAVAPHVDPPGTPLFHPHAFAAYRLPLFLGILRARFDPHQGLMNPESLFDAAATLVLALLVVAWPRLPRPTLLALADIEHVRIARALWRSPLIVGPPRAALHA